MVPSPKHSKWLRTNGGGLRKAQHLCFFEHLSKGLLFATKNQISYLIEAFGLSGLRALYRSR